MNRDRPDSDVSPVAVRLLLVAVVGLAFQDKALDATQKSMAVPTAKVRIMAFGKAVEAGALAAPSSRAGGDVITVTRGESIVLRWHIEGENASSVWATLTGAGSINPGARRDLGGGRFSMTNQRGLRITESGTYTLRVSAAPTGPGSTAVRSIEIVVRNAGVLSNEPPRLDAVPRDVRFFVSNTGETSLPPGAYTVFYSVSGEGNGLAQGNFVTDRIGIGRGRTVELGRVSLPADAYIYRRLRVSYRVSGDGIGTEDSVFTVPWPTEDKRIPISIVEGIIIAVLGDVRINNYDPALRTGEVSPQPPFRRDDSFVTILGTTSRFNLQPVTLTYTVKSTASGATAGEYRYRAFVNSIVLGRNMPELVLRDGKIGFRVTLDTSGPRDVKGFLEESGGFHDGHGPDIDITRLAVEVLLTLSRLGQRITYSRAEVDVDVQSAFAGGWSVIDFFKPDISRNVERTIADIVRGSIVELLDTDTSRSRLAEQFRQFLRPPEVLHVFDVWVESDGVHFLIIKGPEDDRSRRPVN